MGRSILIELGKSELNVRNEQKLSIIYTYVKPRFRNFMMPNYQKILQSKFVFKWLILSSFSLSSTVNQTNRAKCCCKNFLWAFPLFPFTLFCLNFSHFPFSEALPRTSHTHEKRQHNTVWPSTAVVVSSAAHLCARCVTGKRQREEREERQRWRCAI